ncbi:hypothetical protein J8M01_07545 [Pseudoalteromonas sp. MMG005]|nr:hypothetical protein [Pseudoalteromonas sp. MMG005]
MIENVLRLWTRCIGVSCVLCTVLVEARTVDMSASFPSLHISQQATNNQHGVSGLDNPRKIATSRDKKSIFVVSGDDDALSVFQLDSDDQLYFKQTFKNIDNNRYKLAGASDVIALDNGKWLITASFYDGALSLFSKVEQGGYQFVHSLSDDLSAKRVFKDPTPVGGLDNLKLLAPWSILKLDEQHFVVASYKSDAVRFFKLSNGRIVTNEPANKGVNKQQFGSPVAVQPIMNKETGQKKLIVAGFNDSTLTLLDKGDTQYYAVSQRISLKEYGCLNPQAMQAVEIINKLYVACSGSDKVLVLQESQPNQFKVIQVVAHPHLQGVNSLAMARDGRWGYAASEKSNGVIVLQNKPLTGLSVSTIVLDNTPVVSSISSLTLTRPDLLVVTSAKQDTLYLLNVTAPH